MRLTLELSQDIESRLQAKADRRGLSLSEYLLALAVEDIEEQETYSEGTAADLFAGRIGRIAGSTEAFSQNCGERFTEGLLKKKRCAVLEIVA